MLKFKVGLLLLGVLDTFDCSCQLPRLAGLRVARMLIGYPLAGWDQPGSQPAHAACVIPDDVARLDQGHQRREIMRLCGQVR